MGEKIEMSGNMWLGPLSVLDLCRSFDSYPICCETLQTENSKPVANQYYVFLKADLLTFSMEKSPS